jgi:uncharacterized protein (DUF2147 family)
MRAGFRSAPQILAVVAFVMSIAVCTTGFADNALQDRILGNWLTEDRDGVIQIIRRADGRFDGRIVAGNDIERTDKKNPDPAKRKLRLRGETIVEGLRYEGGNRWAGGTVYDPDSGHTYRCHLELTGPDTLRLRGFIGISLLGRSQVWTRFQGPVVSP